MAPCFPEASYYWVNLVLLSGALRTPQPKQLIQRNRTQIRRKQPLLAQMVVSSEVEFGLVKYRCDELALHWHATSYGQFGNGRCLISKQAMGLEHVDHIIELLISPMLGKLMDAPLDLTLRDVFGFGKLC